MRRATFLSSLFTLVVVCAGLQLVSMYWSPVSSMSGDVQRGRFSVLVGHDNITDGANYNGVKRRGSFLNMRTPFDAPMRNVSALTSGLLQSTARRRDRLLRKRATEAEAKDRWGTFLKGVAKKVVGISIEETGNIEPPREVAESIHIRTEYHEFSEAELLERHRNLDIVYTWVNGSEINHLFRKYFRRNSIRRQALSDGHPVTQFPRSLVIPQAFGVHEQNNVDAKENEFANSTGFRLRKWVPLESPGGLLSSFRDVESFLNANRGRVVNSRDRESDELRFSMRSLDQFVDWHHGRIVIVSPGHCPLWLDHSNNFFARSQRPVGHVRRRVVAVHQDALLPGNQRLTFNTNTVEQHIHKIKNLSELFVQFNDDYFVNHPTTVSDFVNKWGGAILLHEGGEVRGAQLAYKQLRKIWLGGVYHSNSFNIRELEEVPAKYVPHYVAEAVRTRAGLPSVTQAATTTATIAPPPPTTTTTADVATLAATTEAPAPQITIAETALPSAAPTVVGRSEGSAEVSTSSPPAPAANMSNGTGVDDVTPAVRRRLMEAMVSHQRFKLAGGRPVPRVLDDNGNELHEQVPKRKRYFLKHAPFVYCKRMHQYLAERYPRDFTAPAVANPHRNKEDLLMPFIHNAFIVEQPWAGSPNYLPHLVQLADNESRALASGVPRADIPVTTLTVRLDNFDGCAPALNKIGEAARSLLVIFIDDIKENENRIQRLADVDPVFFALNDGFSRPAAAEQLQRFMATKYPERSVFETISPFVGGGDDDAKVEGDTVVSNSASGGETKVFAAAVSSAISETFRELMALPLLVVVTEEDVDVACPLSRSLQLGMPHHRGPLFIAVEKSGSTPIRETGDAIPDRLPRLLTKCVFNTSTTVQVAVSSGDVQDLSSAAQLWWSAAERVAGRSSPSVTLRRDIIDLLPDHYGDEQLVRGFVFDVRRSLQRSGPYALHIVGQTLALEDFALLPPAEAAVPGRWLYLSPSSVLTQRARESEATAASGVPVPYWDVNWIAGASSTHLLHTFPVPHTTYESGDVLRYVFGDETSW